MNIFKIYKLFEECPFTAIAHTVGRVKRDIGTIYVGFAYLNSPQQFEIATKLANPTQQEWLQSVGLTLLPIYRLGPRSGFPLCFFSEDFVGSVRDLAAKVRIMPNNAVRSGINPAPTPSSPIWACAEQSSRAIS